MSTETERQFVTLSQAVALSGLSEVTLRRAVKRGELQFYRAANYRLHLDKAELTAWLENRATPQPVAPRKKK